ncbi:MAG: CvpA family protein [Clostridia bacterium]|nr:CvpA family protein [Clostridia bacterium]
MPNITSIVLLITVFALGLGFALGFLRGFNRSLLRAGLVVASLVLAIAFRGAVTGFLMDFDLGGETLKQTLVAAFSDASLPVALQDLVMVLVEIMIGVAAFLVVFALLALITWLVVYPICKIVVRKGIHKRRILGAVVGLAQGALVAFAFCAPITGLAVQIDKVSDLELDGKPVIEVPAELGVSDYITSAPGKLYNSIGAGFFNMLTSGKTADGKNVTIDDAVSIVVTVGDIANTVTKVEDSMNVMTDASATPQQQVNAMQNLGDSLVSIGNSVDSLSNDAKAIVNDVVSAIKDMESIELPPEVEDVLDNFDISSIDFAAAGNAISGIATYIQKTDDSFDNDLPVTSEDVNKIVNGLAGNELILSLVTQGDSVPTLIEIADEGHQQMFEDAIAGSSLSADDKAALQQLFGLVG